MICQLCHQDDQWHREHKPKHAFVGPDDDPILLADPGPVVPPTTQRGDPVLRLALVKSGALTDHQIFEAEIWIREAAETGKAVVVEDGVFKLLDVDEWISRMASR